MDSDIASIAGLTIAIIVVLQLPPNESFSKYVNLLSRYGANHKSVLLFDNVINTLDKHDKDKAKEIKELLTSVGIQLDESTKSHVLNISEDQLSKLEVIHLENKDGNDYTNTKEKEKGKEKGIF